MDYSKHCSLQRILPKLALLLLLITWNSATASTGGKQILKNLMEQQDTSTTKKPARQKNVLFIAFDDLRASIGCYGDSIALTPNMDKLAARGIRFNNAYSQQSVCAPSRASVLTGRRPNSTKVWDLETHFRTALPQVVTLPQYFKQHGYFTQSVGKIYHDPQQAQDPPSWSAPEILAVTDKFLGRYALVENTDVLKKSRGFKAHATERAQVPDNAYIDGMVADRAISVLNRVKDKPFFLAVGFRRPHLPFVAPEKYWVLYDSIPIPPPTNPLPPKNVPEIALHNWKELRGYTDIPKNDPVTDPEKIRQLLQGYYASTSFVDAQLGKLLSELDRLGLTENTIIVLWSDHGFHLGEHGLWAKTTNFELDTRVPLIVVNPGEPLKNVKSDALVELVDIYPTLVDLAGLPIPEDLEGLSMAPLLKDPQRSWKSAVFSQFLRERKDNDIMGYSVRTKEFRYTEWQDFQTDEFIACELYDEINDPKETVNLVGQKDQQQNVKALSEVLRKGWEAALPIANPQKP
ncbi:sulfatase [Sphingobacterium shayense]|uniref:sulfatase n=1 Tax=Sphingobacterium shayense TaxID=626343 RepID=UPI001FE67389|nr:sulfatase [Sphingobacterium shayense]